MVEGVDENTIIMDIFEKLNPDKVNKDNKSSNNSSDDRKNIKYEIKQNIGCISKTDKGWIKELNIVSWNNNKPKYDLREWDSTHEKMSKGITFSADELKKLKDILNSLDIQ